MAQDTPNHAATRQNYRSIALSAIFVLLNAMDAQLTLLAVSKGAIETNPLLRLLLTHSDWLFWFFKISCPLVIVLALIIAARRWPHPTNRILTVLVGAIAVICIFNSFVGAVL